MHKLMADLEKMDELKRTLTCWVEAEVGEGKEYCSDPKVIECLGQVVDMIKDIADAEKNCVEKKLKEEELKMMIEEGEDGEERMGYDNWRYSSGRYAPKGHGHYDSAGRQGFSPLRPMWDGGNPHVRIHMPEINESLRMGYPDGNGNRGDGRSTGDSTSSRSNYNNGGRMGYMPMPEDGYYDYMSPSRYGIRYEDYKDAKRHYTKEKTPENAKHMNMMIQECIGDSLEAVNEMWKDADPETKKKIEQEFSETLMTMKKENGAR